MKLYTSLCMTLRGETLSVTAAKAARNKKRWGCVFCKLLDLFDKNHCEKELEDDG